MTQRTYLIAKAQSDMQRRKGTGLAEMAAGGAIATGTPAAYRGEMRYRAGVRAKAEAERAAVRRRAEARIKEIKAKRIPGETLYARSLSRGKVRAQYGKINEANRVANAVIRNKGKMRYFNQQSRTWGIGAGVGGALALHGAHRRDKAKVGKRERSHDHTTTAATAGALAGAGGYHGASIALKRPEKKAERVINADPALKRRLEAHRSAHLPKNATAGHPGWKTFNRQYPKDLPGWRPKRFWGHATSGKTGIAATGVVSGAAGLAAAKRERRKVEKSFLPGGQAKHANRLSRLERRNLKFELKRKAARREGALPGLGRTSGFSPTPRSQGPYIAKVTRKELHRLQRVREGLPVSDVRRRP